MRRGVRGVSLTVLVLSIYGDPLKESLEVEAEVEAAVGSERYV